MPEPEPLILGEFLRTLDDRYRLSLPAEMVELLCGDDFQCILAKQRKGCLSLWNARRWQPRLEEGMELVRRKIQAGKLEGRVAEVQLLGRLLSTRHKAVQLSGRGRLLIPEGFREFLGVEPGANVAVVGAAVCIELWAPAAWTSHLEKHVSRFRRLFERLSS